METFYNDLKNQNTLAPLEEASMTTIYAPKNLTQRDSSILARISQSSISAIETTIGSLTHLIQNLKIYKECMIDSINLQAESADISTKYGTDIPQQSNTLPGLNLLPQTFDLQDIRKDNERMMAMKDQKDKVMNQKDIYLRLANEDVRLFLSSWKRLNLSNSSFDEFIDGLHKGLNPNY